MSNFFNDFELTEAQKISILEDPEFKRIVARVVFQTSSELEKSYRDLIIDRVCEVFEVTREGIFSKSRVAENVLARYMCMYIMNLHLKEVDMSSSSEVAEFFGRERTIINHANKVIDWEIFKSRKVSDTVKDIKNLIKIKRKNEQRYSVR